MQRKFGLLLAVLLTIAAVLAANVVIGRATRAAKLDLTQGRQFTLTSGSRNIAQSPQEPIKLTFYYSQKLAQGLPDVQTYAKRVQEMLEQYRDASGGKIELDIVDPEPDSDAEDRAVEGGLRGIPMPTGENLFLGLVGTNTIDSREVIPIFDPTKDRFLEYDISRLISALATPKKPVVAYISPLQLEGGARTNFRTRQPEPVRQWQVLDEIKQLYTVRKLDPATIVEIPSDVNVLMVVHPKGLNEGALLAIDQFVLKGGRLLLFVDPLCEADSDGTPWQQNDSRVSELTRILTAWGVEVPQGLLAGDQDLALRVIDNQRGQQEQVPYVVWLGLRAAQMNREDPVTSQAQTINLGTSGFIQKIDGAANPLEIVPLLSTTDKANVVSVTQLGDQWNPRKLFSEFVPGAASKTLAARLTGTAKTAFPDGPPSNADGKPMIDAEKMLKQSTGPVNVMLFADVDLLRDEMWIQVQNFAGMRMVNRLANNGDMILAAVDNFAGSDDLIQIRARQTTARPFTKVEEIRRLAEQKYQKEEVRLANELQETQQRIAELQGQRGDDKTGGLVLTPEQQAEVKKFQQQAVDTRKKLREVRFNLRKDIEDLGTTLKWINIAAVPLGVIAAAIIIAFIRRFR